MQINDILAQMGGLQSVARELGVSEADVAKGAEALVPAILGGVKKQVQTQAGSPGGLGGLLTQLGGGLLENVLSPQPTDVGLGNNVLGQIFGSKDVSRAVAANAAALAWFIPNGHVVWALALPMVFSNVTTPLLGLVDTWVIGHLGQAWFLGGVSVGATLINLIFWLLGGVQRPWRGLWMVVGALWIVLAVAMLRLGVARWSAWPSCASTTTLC